MRFPFQGDLKVVGQDSLSRGLVHGAVRGNRDRRPDTLVASAHDFENRFAHNRMAVQFQFAHTLWYVDDQERHDVWLVMQLS